MSHDDLEILRFRACRRFDGRFQRIQMGRRNGKPAAFFHPDSFEPSEPPIQPRDFADQERFFVNLNAVERETWRKILAARSINSIAKEENVTRSPIYARLQGNSKGQGGMAAKNFWVCLWLNCRRRLAR